MIEGLTLFSPCSDFHSVKLLVARTLYAPYFLPFFPFLQYTLHLVHCSSPQVPPYLTCDHLIFDDRPEQLHVAVVHWFLYEACPEFFKGGPTGWVLLVTTQASQVARLAAWLPRPLRQVAIYRGPATMEELPVMVGALLRQPVPERVLERWVDMDMALASGEPVWTGYAPPPPPPEGEDWEFEEEAAAASEEELAGAAAPAAAPKAKGKAKKAKKAADSRAPTPTEDLELALAVALTAPEAPEEPASQPPAEASQPSMVLMPPPAASPRPKNRGRAKPGGVQWQRAMAQKRLPEARPSPPPKKKKSSTPPVSPSYSVSPLTPSSQSSAYRSPAPSKPRGARGPFTPPRVLATEGGEFDSASPAAAASIDAMLRRMGGLPAQPTVLEEAERREPATDSSSSSAALFPPPTPPPPPRAPGAEEGEEEGERDPFQ